MGDAALAVMSGCLFPPKHLLAGPLQEIKNRAGERSAKWSGLDGDGAEHQPTQAQDDADDDDDHRYLTTTPQSPLPLASGIHPLRIPGAHL